MPKVRTLYPKGLIVLALIGPSISRATAAIVESPLWSLFAEADASGGYDSNLFAVNGGPGDWFSKLKPVVSLSRKDSMVSFDTDAWVDFTTFRSETGNDSVDPGLRIEIGYPANVPDTAPFDKVELHLIRSTDVNIDVAGRVSQVDALAKYEGRLVDTGKLYTTGRLSADRDEYVGSAYDTISTATIGTTIAYAPDELFQEGIGVDVTEGLSQPNQGTGDSLHQSEEALTIQATGEFTPKVTGKASLGAAYSRYTGSFRHTEWDSVASADITWEPEQRLDFELKASRAPTFNIDGDVDLVSSVSLEARKGLAGGVSISVYALAGHIEHDRITTYRTDNMEGGGAGLDYDLTGKLTASISFQRTRQDSDTALFSYGRDVITGRLTYKF
jgi:hypothetical protein